MLPETALDGLTPEDLRLLLNGVGDINVNLLISYTSFSDESGPGNSDKVTKIKRWLWSIVEKMTQMERMDLVYNSLVEIVSTASVISRAIFLFRCISGLGRQLYRLLRMAFNQCPA